MAYFAYFRSIVGYGIIFWGNATNNYKVFKLQKRVIRIMSGAKPRASRRGLFWRLEILNCSLSIYAVFDTVYYR